MARRASRHLAAVPDPDPAPLPPAASTEFRWVVAGTFYGEPYPCRCRKGGGCQVLWCWCAGRVDLDQVPAHCCARTNTPQVWKAANDRSEREKAAKRSADRAANTDEP